MSVTREEISSQPQMWRQVTDLLPQVARQLPTSGERVAIVGCGTSYFIAQAVAVARESAGQGETDAFVASEMPSGRPYDRVIAISRSGTTTEVVRCLESLPTGVPGTAEMASDRTAGGSDSRQRTTSVVVPEREIASTRS